MEPNKLPELTRTYQNHTFDSTRWRHYTPRGDDIIISTSYKSGTTWMQHIVFELIFLDQEMPDLSVSPWIDARFGGPIEEMMEMLEAQQHRRCIKTHLPLDALPFHPQIKYIVVARDPRDVFMSFCNHYSNYTDAFYDRLNDTSGLVGDPIPRCPKDIHELWRIWIKQGWFEWESEGYPHSGNMYHTQAWWNFRHLKNILLVHFNDLLANLEGEIERIATYLEIEASTEAITTVAQAVTFSTLKKNVLKKYTGGLSGFKGGANTFYYKGTNGRWQGVLSEKELAMCEAKMAEMLTPGCAQWLEDGRFA